MTARTTPPFRADHVGSFLRPAYLLEAREQFFGMVESIRPDLHRYCARLTGSVIDGEDVVQDALAKALYALSLLPEVPELRPWLFRIAHNQVHRVTRRSVIGK